MKEEKQGGRPVFILSFGGVIFARRKPKDGKWPETQRASWKNGKKEKSREIFSRYKGKSEETGKSKKGQNIPSKRRGEE